MPGINNIKTLPVNKVNTQFTIIIFVLMTLFIIIIYSIYIEKSSIGQYYDDNSDNDVDEDEENNENTNTSTNNSNNSDNRNNNNDNKIDNNNNTTGNNDTTENNNTNSNNQVYNIGSNLYTYNDASAVCEAHNGKLATREQVIHAYKKGADWCNYGWTENQEALFPTQKESWDKLQKLDPKNRNDCGTIGLNGGYFENSKYLFGVNCYGKKPNPKNDEVMKPENNDNPFNNSVQNYRDTLDQIKVLPFNKDKWSEHQ